MTSYKFSREVSYHKVTLLYCKFAGSMKLSMMHVPFFFSPSMQTSHQRIPLRTHETGHRKSASDQVVPTEGQRQVDQRRRQVDGELNLSVDHFTDRPARLWHPRPDCAKYSQGWAVPVIRVHRWTPSFVCLCSESGGSFDWNQAAF